MHIFAELVLPRNAPMDCNEDIKHSDLPSFVMYSMLFSYYARNLQFPVSCSANALFAE